MAIILCVCVCVWTWSERVKTVNAAHDLIVLVKPLRRHASRCYPECVLYDTKCEVRLKVTASFVVHLIPPREPFALLFRFGDVNLSMHEVSAQSFPDSLYFAVDKCDVMG